ncbi:Acetophenone carboxylase delta subunit [Thalassovita gelatinovora]|uniref:Acetophenone carboxylase delta subunit n=1 Tax=Thalassovita gelatinovora TaxID=53501 RepID=A0A0P1F6P4_THAGE|nr:hydantoinase B/oxoprolinase family protein [Thalassovita gelatinovora]QIZ79157.1 hydantoinase B/oxoprolinase family protein [Thalassovita gelatinovora]CUH63609.1 Acetophenone carboxylase delta subunit [Thalassovita gelatinovora]SER00470.1 N-methylhydantoinase B [Thalassovita gelatinovora]
MSDDLKILQLRLDGLAETMQQTLLRCAVSPVVREGADASCALFSYRGEVLALAEAIPLLLGALPGSVNAILEAYPTQNMRPGDVFVSNDPFAGGTHLPDIAVVQPVFIDGVLVAFTASLLHHQDIGSTRPGSVPPDATEIYHEGLRLPPLQAGRDGVFDREFLTLIRAASRVPDVVVGDLETQLAAGFRAAEGLKQLATETGAAAFLTATDALLDRAEEETVKRLASLTPGPFHGFDELDPVEGLGPCAAQVALRFTNGRMVADFEGSSPQVAAPVNCVRSGPLSATFYGLLTLVGDDALRNGGVLRCLDLNLPEASVVNASLPAAVNARMNMVRCVTSALLQALAEADGDRMPAANSGMSFVIAFSGRDGTGNPFLSTEIVAGGAGGGPTADGCSAISTDVGNAMNTSAEALEALVPMRLVSAKIRSGSGGAGRFRGGEGVCRTYEALVDGISASIRGERFSRVAKGAHGGGAPKGSAATVLRADGEKICLTARSAVVLNQGDHLVIESSGGAGYGVPDA